MPRSSSESLDARSPRMIFARKLREWRKKRGLGLKQVASDFGVAEGTWARWEQGNRFPSPENIRLLADFVGLAICDFFYRDTHDCPRCPLDEKGEGK